MLSADMQGRAHYIDWLRAIAVLLLVPFHAAMIFVPWGFHIMSPETHLAFEVLNHFLHLWHMPLLFVLAGAGSWFALGRRTAAEYAGERVRRLLAPLIFGTLAVAPPQTYFQRMQQHGWLENPGLYPGEMTETLRARVEAHAFQGSYLEFYPSIFRGVYPDGNFSWHHLWFLAYLFVFSMIALPLFLRWRGPERADARERLARFWARPARLLLLCVPFMFSEALLRPVFRGLQTLVTDWANFVLYLGLFILGFFLCAHPRFGEVIEQYRRRYLLLALAITLALAALMLAGFEPAWAHSPAFAVFRACYVLAMWCWLLALIGHARARLDFSNGFLRYFTPAVLPFYILHQTVLIVAAYHVLQWGWSIWAAYAFLCVAAAAGSIVLYEVAVRRTRVTRFLFGMKAAPPRAR